MKLGDDNQYFLNPTRMKETEEIEKRIQSIREEISDCHPDEQNVNKLHDELNAYKVKIENFFSKTEENLFPIKEKLTNR